MTRQLPTDHPLVRSVLRSLKVILTEADERIIADLVAATLPKHYLNDPQPDQNVGVNKRAGDYPTEGGLVGSGVSPNKLNTVHAPVTGDKAGVHDGSLGVWNEGTLTPTDPVLDSALRTIDRGNKRIDSLEKMLMENTMALFQANENSAHATNVAEDFCNKYTNARHDLEAIKKEFEHVVKLNSQLGDKNHALRKRIHTACDVLQTTDTASDQPSPSPLATNFDRPGRDR